MSQPGRIKAFFEFRNELNEAANGRLSQSELIPIQTAGGKSSNHKLNAEAAKAYNDMVAAAKAEGVTWGITDSYRDYDAQVDVAARKGLYKYGGLAAVPGTSNHGWGSAVDLDLNDSASKWLKDNAARFGFSTIPREPWHWEHKASSQKSASSPGSSIIPKTVMIDSDLVTRLISKLKEKGFSQDDLKKFSVKKSTGDPVKGERVSGAGGKISDENIKLLYDAMDKYGISNKYAREAILGVISKESSTAQSEISYANTPNSRIREVFGERVSGLRDDELNRVKADPKQFFELVYGKDTKVGRELGNTEYGEGYRYRGRGFNGITGKGNYRSLQALYKGGDVDIVSNPELLDRPEIAAEFAILYFVRSFNRHNKSMDEYTSIEDAVRDFTQANHGWGRSIDSSAIGREGYSKALAYARSRIQDTSMTA